MANTYTSFFVQTVFAVKYRDAMIQKEWKEEFFSVIGRDSCESLNSLIVSVKLNKNTT